MTSLLGRVLGCNRAIVEDKIVGLVEKELALEAWQAWSCEGERLLPDSVPSAEIGQTA